MDRDWQDAGTRRQAFYSNLPPRHYIFHVKACNNSGVWNEAGSSLAFSVVPAYYQTTWFRLSCVAAFLGLLAALYQLRLRQLAQQFNKRMEERVNERTRIARDLHDTLLQNVQGLILKLHGVAKHMRSEDPSRQAIEKALDHADQVLAEGRDRVRDLRATGASLRDLSAAFQRVAQEISPSRAAALKTTVEGKVRQLHPMVLEESFSIGREALVNAFTHSEGLHIEVEITYDFRQFCLRVRDDGRGIDPGILDKGGRDDHWGLQGMKERAGRIGAQLEILSRPGTGTEVGLTVPAAVAYRALDGKPKTSWFRRPTRMDGCTTMTANKLIRILSVDDHPVLREGIAAVLAGEPDMVLVAEASNGREAIEQFRTHRPDITLMDLQMPVMSGSDAIVAIRKDFPDARIIVLTTYSGDAQADRAFKAGAYGYLLKSMVRKELVETIRCVHGGRKRMPPEIAIELAEHHTQDALSAREIEVLGQVASGNSNKMIADNLNLSEETIKAHMRSIFSKLEANDRSHALAIALKRGIIEI